MRVFVLFGAIFCFALGLHSQTKATDILEPEMILVPTGSFRMGTPAWAEKPNLSPRIPPIEVSLDYSFWVSQFEITREEYLVCIEDNACSSEFVDMDADLPGRLPINGINMDGAQTYVRWLSRETGKSYRLLTGTEWEYAARGGATGIYATGKYLKPEQANFFPRCGGARETIDKCLAQMDASSNYPRTIAQPKLVGQYSPNGFGLYDVHGNVAELVSDCIVWDASTKPSSPSIWQNTDCTHAYYRGGYFQYSVMGQRLDALMWTVSETTLPLLVSELLGMTTDGRS